MVYAQAVQKSDPPNLPLKGIRVVEFTHMVMGPSIGLILAELGADVIKVEPVGGDRTRNLVGSGAGYFPMFNRNKRSICIDLKTAAEYSEGGLAVPLVVGGRAVGGLVMRYIKRSLKNREIEQDYFPKLQKLADDIASGYEARVSAARIEKTIASSPTSRPAIAGSASLQVVIAGRQLSA